jgi:Flp pilus assembly protein TadG
MIALKRLLADTRGTSLIELGMTAPLLAFLLLGSVDMARGYSERLSLQQAANRTIEMATVRGQVNGSYSYLQAQAATASGEPTSNVTVDSWLACDDARQSSFDGTCGGNQQVARYVSIRIVGTHQPIIDYAGLAQLYGGYSLSRNIGIEGEATVRVQ